MRSGCYGSGVRPNWPLVLLILLAPFVVAWPLPAVFTSQWLTTPFGEAAIHVWGLWTTAAGGNLFQIDTAAIAWPDGAQAVLADPINLPWFLLGWPLGPEAAYNAVVYGNLIIMGLAGLCLARHVGGLAWLGALAAMLNPSVLGAITGGMTEHLSLGWLGLFVAALLAALQKSCNKRALLAGLLLAVTVASGPYNGVWATGIATAIGVAHLVRKDRTRHFAPLAITAGTAGVLAAPLITSVLTQRLPGQPGTAELSRSLFALPAANTSLFRGGLRFGADLSDPWLPIFLTGGTATPTYTAYVGLAALILAAVVVARNRIHWGWLIGALVFSLLSLGPWMVWEGRPLVANGNAFMAPAGMLADTFPVLTRISHWHRAGGVAALLLVPLVALAPSVIKHRVSVPIIALLLCADRLVGSPVPWPLPTMSGPDTQAYAALSGTPGAVLVQPARFLDLPPPRARFRDPALLAQLYHQHPVSESGAMGHGLSASGQHANDLLHRLGETGYADAGHKGAFEGPGFLWLAVYPRQMLKNPKRDQNWARCLGRPLINTADVQLYDLKPGINPRCLRGGGPTGGPPAPEGPDTF